MADAVEAGWTIRTLVHASAVANQPLVRRLAATAHAKGGSVIAVSEAVLEKISRRDNPQTVLGVFEQRLTAVDSIRPAGNDVWVALEAVRDPGNLGTIVRTADAVGARGVILVGNTVDPFSVEAVRATMGSIFAVPLARASIADFARLARRWPGPVVGTHLAGQDRLSRRRLSRTGAAGHGRRAGRADGGCGGPVQDAHQDPDGGQGRLAQPRHRHRRHAVRDPPRGADARWLRFIRIRGRPDRSPPSASASSWPWSSSTRSAKLIVQARLPEGQPIDVLPILALLHVRNTGIAFSLLANSGFGVILLPLVVTAVVLAFWAHNREGGKLAAAGFALILGGAIGNLIDRLRLGYVTDFLLLHFGDWTLFVFNLADAALTLGPALLLLVYLWPAKKDA